MSTRAVDPHFDQDEAIWRRIEKNNIVAKTNTVKASALRLQVSVVRQRHGVRDSVTEGKFNGIAETTALKASSVTTGDARFACIDDPNKDQPGHALLALLVEPGKTATQAHLNAVREQLALQFRVVQSPT